jgi:hypothetical protein
MKEAFSQIKRQQTKSIVSIFIFFILTLGVYLKDNINVFITTVTILVLVLRFFLKSFNDKEIAEKICEESFDMNNLASNKNKILKISSIFNENSKEIMNYITNLKNYKEWNPYLKAINDFKKEDNSAKYLYAKNLKNEEGEYVELKLKRKIISSSHPVILIESLESDNSSSRIRFIVIENSISGEKCKVTIYLPLRSLIEGKLPYSYIKSNLKSLDMLHLYINNKNFNNNFITEDGKDEIQVKPKIDKETLRKSMTINTSLKLDFDNLNQPNKENLRCSIVSNNLQEEKNRISEFHEFNNRFSEVNEKDKETLIKEEINQTKNEISESQITNISINPEVALIDPIIEKENEEVILLVSRKFNEIKSFLDKSWKIMEEKKDYKLYYFDEPNGLRSVKSEIVIDKNIKTVWDYLTDFNHKAKYDTNFDCGHNIREINDTYVLQYMKYKGKFMISPRDFTIISMKKYVN